MNLYTMTPFCLQINYSLNRSLNSCSYPLLFLVFVFTLLNYISVNGQSAGPLNTLVVDSAFAHTLNSTWKPIEKSFVILDSTLSQPTTWQEFKNLDSNASFRKVNKYKIPLQLNQSSWVKMKIKNPLSTTLNLAMYVKNSQAEVFIRGQDKFEKQFAGEFYPKSTWNTKTYFKGLSDPYIIDFQLKPYELKEITIKLSSFIKIKETSIHLTKNEYAYKELSSDYLARNLIQGFCLGMLSIMLFYNLFTFFASKRDYNYLLNSLYILCLVIWFFTTSQLARLTFFAEHPLLTEFITISSGVGIGVFYVVFCRAIIGKGNIPRFLNRLINYFLYMEIASVFLINILTWLFIFFNFSNMIFIRSIFPPTGLLGVFVSMLFIFYMFKIGSKLSNVLAVSSCFVLLAASLAIFGDLIFLIGNASDSLKTTNSPYSLIIEFAFIVQILLFGYATGIREKELEKEKVRLEELNIIKSQFFTDISHEIRTPLSLVLGPIKQLMSQLKDKTHRALLETSYKSGNRMLVLINQILDLSKIEANSMPMNITHINIVELFNNCLSMFNSRANQRNIKLTINSSSPEIYVYVDRDKMEKIAFNLISNAVKFNRENGAVKISVVEELDDLQIVITDEGVGMAKNELGKIFNRFYQVNASGVNSHSGSGIGLALVKELVELHHGNIEVQSQTNVGTTFSFRLKKGKAHFANVRTNLKKLPEKWVDETIVEGVPSGHIATPIFVNAEAPIVLIIEDHRELHDYIKGLLSKHYQVLSTFDGSKGIEKAIQVIPDLIVSDVMMPEKDGLEVCTTLKTDERTSHIPIILLTAKAEIEAKIVGLETGADEYLAKPFDHQELLIRIKNLLHQRSVLREKFKNELHFVPDEIAFNQTDKRFARRILQVVNTNLSNETFGVDELASEMAMSRTQLNRKLRDLLDQSTNKFIQSCRLNSAVELLKIPGNTVSQVAYATGFSSDAYFVKCFKDYFGSTPGAYFDQK